MIENDYKFTDEVFLKKNKELRSVSAKLILFINLTHIYYIIKSCKTIIQSNNNVKHLFIYAALSFSSFLEGRELDYSRCKRKWTRYVDTVKNTRAKKLHTRGIRGMMRIKLYHLISTKPILKTHPTIFM